MVRENEPNYIEKFDHLYYTTNTTSYISQHPRSMPNSVPNARVSDRDFASLIGTGSTDDTTEYLAGTIKIPYSSPHLFPKAAKPIRFAGLNCRAANLIGFITIPGIPTISKSQSVFVALRLPIH